MHNLQNNMIQLNIHKFMVYDKNSKYLRLFLKGKSKADEGCNLVREATLPPAVSLFLSCYLLLFRLL
jgi:hypothetical protein